MHIAEGVLSAPVLAAGGALAALGTALGLSRIDYDRIMTVAILAATFFVATLIHVPIGPAAGHLVLGGLLGAILGPACFPAILVGLLLQALLFQYGGLIVLGVNTFNMAFPALLCFYLCRPFLRRGGTARIVAAFLAGALSIALSGMLTAASLALSDQGFWTAAQVILIGHLPIMAVEGVITVFVVGFLARVQPDILAWRPGTPTVAEDAS